MPAKVQIKDIVQDMQRVYQEIQRVPTTTDYDLHGQYTSVTVRKNFHSWNNALFQCGINPIQPEHKWTDQELQNELERVTKITGHVPSWTDLKKHSKISVDTLNRRIGFSYRKTPDISLFDISRVNPEHGAMVAGLVTGEGSFTIRNEGSLTFSVGLRADDQCVLEFIRDTMQLPVKIHFFKNTKRREAGQQVGDEARLHIANKIVLKNYVIPFFDRFSLLGRKALDYAIFKEATLFLCQRDENGRFHSRHSQAEKEQINKFHTALQALRFDPSKCIIDQQITAT